MKILVTGGNGYIGSHVAVSLMEAGFSVAILDDLSNSHKANIERISQLVQQSFRFFQTDITNPRDLAKTFLDFQPDLVIHCAGVKSVEESIYNPEKYEKINVDGTKTLLRTMEKIGCEKLIFSSSATVYGMPTFLPVNETHKLEPLNPYGESKILCEKIIKEWTEARRSRVGIALRYYNPAGAHSSGIIGESPSNPPTNLVPILASICCDAGPPLKIFGSDYPTRDGTPARDYIHIEDLADAHVSAVNHSLSFTGFRPLNIGTGASTTVLELVREFEAAVEHRISVKFVDRRPGDAGEVYAEATEAAQTLSWKAVRSISETVKSAYLWQKKTSTKTSISQDG